MKNRLFSLGALVLGLGMGFAAVAQAESVQELVRKKNGVVEARLAVGDTFMAGMSLPMIAVDGTDMSKDLLARDTAQAPYLFFDFFQATCGPCHRNLANVKSLYLQSAPKLLVRSVNIDRDVAGARKYVADNRADIRWEVALDSQRQSWKASAASSTPTMLLLDKDNRVAKIYVGVLSAAEMSEIAELVASSK